MLRHIEEDLEEDFPDHHSCGAQSWFIHQSHLGRLKKKKKKEAHLQLKLRLIKSEFLGVVLGNRQESLNVQPRLRVTDVVQPIHFMNVKTAACLSRRFGVYTYVLFL